MSDDPPKVGDSPSRSIPLGLTKTMSFVVNAGGVSVKVSKRAWGRLAGWIRGLILAAAGAAGVAVARHFLGF